MTEQQPYEVVRDAGNFELRRYREHVVAETTVSADFERAGNQAFRYLFGYISGDNTRAIVLDDLSGGAISCRLGGKISEDRDDGSRHPARRGPQLRCGFRAAGQLERGDCADPHTGRGYRTHGTGQSGCCYEVLGPVDILLL